jgi:hypothetical protein
VNDTPPQVSQPSAPADERGHDDGSERRSKCADIVQDLRHIDYTVVVGGQQAANRPREGVSDQEVM